MWPAIHRHLTDATLTIAGAGAPKTLVRAATAAPNVTLTGEVPDLLPFYRRADIFIAPLFIGSGIKFKLVQALFCGLPVITTALGVEGLEGLDRKRALLAVADDASEWISVLRRALTDSHWRVAVGAQARDYALSVFDFDAQMARISDLYRDLILQRTSAGDLVS